MARDLSPSGSPSRLGFPDEGQSVEVQREAWRTGVSQGLGWAHS